MPGPLPKPPNERRRRNKDQGQWHYLPAEGRDEPAPPLPDREWLPTTRAYWSLLWASPMAAEWLPADVPVLVRLAALMELFALGETSAALLGEMRQLEDRFGLSSHARKRLMWQIATSEEAAAPVKLADVRRLRAVDRDDDK